MKSITILSIVYVYSFLEFSTWLKSIVSMVKTFAVYLIKPDWTNISIVSKISFGQEQKRLLARSV